MAAGIPIEIAQIHPVRRPRAGELRTVGCTRRVASGRRGGPAARAASAASLAALLAAAALAGGCLAEEPAVESRHFSIAEPGPWHIPLETLAIGDTQTVPYTGAGPWIGEQGCGGSLLPGTGLLREYIATYFPQAYSIGGYSCRPIVGNSSAMSVHATGRALDIMIQTIDGQADNSAGDVIGNWLIEHAELIGVQMIIWDRWLWHGERAPPKDKEYTGQHPHHDHLHVELSTDAAALLTPFFQNPMQPPELLSCGTVPAAGGVIDDADACAGFYGPREYWRSADGAGHGGSLLWTNAFESTDPSNWARWVLDVEQAGRYRAEVYLDPAYALHDRVRYEVVHDGQVEVLLVDQGQATEPGWYPLGACEFAAGGAQHVSLFDNTDQPVADEQHIAFDALRLTPCEDEECGLGGAEADRAGLSGGCSAGGQGPGGPAAALLLALLLAAISRPAGSRRSR